MMKIINLKIGIKMNKPNLYNKCINKKLKF